MEKLRSGELLYCFGEETQMEPTSDADRKIQKDCGRWQEQQVQSRKVGNNVSGSKWRADIRREHECIYLGGNEAKE